MSQQDEERRTRDARHWDLLRLIDKIRGGDTTFPVYKSCLESIDKLLAADRALHREAARRAPEHEKAAPTAEPVKP